MKKTFSKFISFALAFSMLGGTLSAGAQYEPELPADKITETGSSEVAETIGDQLPAQQQDDAAEPVEMPEMQEEDTDAGAYEEHTFNAGLSYNQATGNLTWTISDDDFSDPKIVVYDANEEEDERWFYLSSEEIEAKKFNIPLNLAFETVESQSTPMSGPLTVRLMCWSDSLSQSLLSESLIINISPGTVDESQPAPTISEFYLSLYGGEEMTPTFSTSVPDVVGYIVGTKYGSSDYCYYEKIAADTTFSGWFSGEDSIVVCSVDKNGHLSPFTDDTSPVMPSYPTWKASPKFDPSTGLITWTKAPIEFTYEEAFDSDDIFSNYTLFANGSIFLASTGTFMNNSEPEINLYKSLANGFENGIYSSSDEFVIKIYAGKGWDGNISFESSETITIKNLDLGKTLSTIPVPALNNITGIQRIRSEAASGDSYNNNAYISATISNYDPDVSYQFRYYTDETSDKGITTFGNIDNNSTVFINNIRFSSLRPEYIDIRACDKTGNYSEWSQKYKVSSWTDEQKCDLGLKLEDGILSWNPMDVRNDPAFANTDYVFYNICTYQKDSGYNNYSDGFRYSKYNTDYDCSYNLFLDLAFYRARFSSQSGDEHCYIGVGHYWNREIYYTDPIDFTFEGGEFDSSIPQPVVTEAYLKTDNSGSDSDYLCVCVKPETKKSIKGYVIAALDDYRVGYLKFVSNDDNIYEIEYYDQNQIKAIAVYAIDENYNVSPRSVVITDFEDRRGNTASVSSISVSANPSKLSYTVGEALDVTGGKIKVKYSDGTTKTIDMTSGMISGFSSSTAGTKTLTVTYSGKTATFTVTVEAAAPAVTAKAGDGSVTLTWNAVDGATKYYVSQVNDDGTYTTISKALTATTITVDGLKNGTAYTFLVQAYANGKWTSSDSKYYVSATPKAAVVPPAVTAKAGDKCVTLTWNAVDGATKYYVSQVDADGTFTTISKALKDTTITVDSLTNGTTYTFLVQAYVNGKWSSSSKKYYVTATPKAAVVPPAVTAKAGDKCVTLTWNAVDGATKYYVSQVNDDGTYTTISKALTATTITVDGLKNGTGYTFLVQAYVDGKWTSSSSKYYVSATPKAAVVPPAVTAKAGDKCVTLTWNAVDGATKYYVSQVNDDGTYTTISKALKDTTITVDSLKNGTEYTFLVQAYVNSKWTSSSKKYYVTATPKAAAPAVTAKAGDRCVILTWDAVDGATKYYVSQVNDDGTFTTISKALKDTTITVDSLKNGTAYTFLVQAYVSGKWTSSSKKYYVTATPKAAAPAVTAKAGDRCVILTWDAVDGATKYYVSQVNDDGTYTTINKALKDTTITVDGLKSGTTYTFLVQAYVSGKWTSSDSKYYVSAVPKE